MPETVTILWEAVDDDELTTLEEAAGENDVQVEALGDRSPGAVLLPLLARGAVVLVARGDREASLALSLGVDEVLRAGEITRPALEAALGRARLRAEARNRRWQGERPASGSPGAFNLLAAALGNELGAPLLVASTSCEVLSSGLGAVLQATDELMGWAATSAVPMDHLRRMVALWAATPSSQDLCGMLDDTRASVDRALGLIRTLRELSFDAGRSYVPVGPLLEELVRLLSGYVGRWADLELRVSGRLVARVGRSGLTLLVASLIAHALDALRAADAGGRVIHIGASEHEGCVLVEVHYGSPAGPGLDPLGGLLGAASGPERLDGTLAAVRQRAQELGGDLLVAQTERTTNLRLILPIAEEVPDIADHDLPDGWDDLRTRPPGA